jgi:hypothetical protein
METTKPKPAADIPLWLSEVKEKMAELLRLPPNWDSYGARPIRPDCVEYGLNTVLARCAPPATPSPAVVPLNTGGILLEWHCRQIDLEVRIEEPGRVHLYFADAKDNHELALDLQDDLLPVLAALTNLTRRG